MPRPSDFPRAVHEDRYFWTAEDSDVEPEEPFEPDNVLDAFAWLQERVNRAVRKT